VLFPEQGFEKALRMAGEISHSGSIQIPSAVSGEQRIKECALVFLWVQAVISGRRGLTKRSGESDREMISA
jgi:hypothetical protein